MMLSSTFLFAQKPGQECFPEQQTDQLVYDVANVLADADEKAMENLLQEFARNTSNQIVVVIVPDLCGMNRADFAIELGEAWGVGQAKSDNGVVVLIKPKTTDEAGKAFIAAGRGLSSAIPAAEAHLIVNNEMIPFFQQNNYAGGINKGLQVIMDLSIGAYDFNTYAGQHKEEKGKSWVSFIFIAIVAIFFLVARGRSVSTYARRNNLGWWAAWLLMSSAGNRHGGFFNNFSGGSGGFRNSGFGGFGGGSFGGDGAGGEW